MSLNKTFHNPWYIFGEYIEPEETRTCHDEIEVVLALQKILLDSIIDQVEM